MNTIRAELLNNAGRRLGANPYPGRVIIIGTNETGRHAVQLYAVMGRSENSRNRVLKTDGHRLFTAPADPTKVKDPSLIIYNAMLSDKRGRHVVSNGNQTDQVIEAFRATAGLPLREALVSCSYEPDDPNWTPRITGLSDVRTDTYFAELSILRRADNGQCRRFYYEYEEIGAGSGFGISTYSGDGNPLPAFTGEPFEVPLIGGIDDIAQSYWETLNEENRVALAVKFIDLESGRYEIQVINKYAEVS